MNNINVGEEIKKYIEDCRSNIKYYDIKNKIFYNAEKIKKKSFDENFNISKAIKEIGNSAKNFNKFYHYLEEIIAYMKYYDFDDK